jgi:hypothetical protein
MISLLKYLGKINKKLAAILIIDFIKTQRLFHKSQFKGHY